VFARSKIFWFDLQSFSQFTCTFNLFTGYPPSDKALRKWLLGLGTDQQEVATREAAPRFPGVTSRCHVATAEALKAIEDRDTLYNYS